jgi:hypothetical protein
LQGFVASPEGLKQDAGNVFDVNCLYIWVYFFWVYFSDWLSAPIAVLNRKRWVQGGDAHDNKNRNLN